IIYADPFGGTWSGDVNEFGEFNPVVLGPGFHNATYYYTDFNGCSNQEDVTFIVNDPVTITFPGDSVFCQSDGPTTLQALPVGGQWSGSAISPAGLVNPSALTPGNYTVTYTYIQQPGGCTYEEDHLIRIVAAPNVRINGDSIFCKTAGLQTFTATPAGGTWIGANGGQVNPDTLSIGNHTIRYRVNYGGNCTIEIPKQITVTAPPTAILSGSGTLCPGGTEEVELTITLTGAGPWEITYTLDNVQQVPVTAGSSPYILRVSEQGTYELVDVTDAGDCVNSATGTADVITVTPLSIQNLNTECNPTNTHYTVTFEIQGGDPASYNVSGISGSVSSTPPYIFTSDLIPSGQGFNFTVSDNSGCAPVSDGVPIVDCACLTEVGNMNLQQIRECGPGTITA